MKKPLLLVRCTDLERQHRRDKTAYCHVGHADPNAICYTPELMRLPSKSRRGILLHEIGHTMRPGHHAEYEADQAVKEVLGIKIRYDRNGLQSL